MGRWRAASLLLNRMISDKPWAGLSPHPLLKRMPPQPSFPSLRPFSAIPSPVSDLDPEVHDFVYANVSELKEDQETGSIPIKAFFISTGFVYFSSF